MAQIYILVFVGDNILFKANNANNPPADGTLQLIKINVGVDNDTGKKIRIKTELNEYNFPNADSCQIHMINAYPAAALAGAAAGAVAGEPGSMFAIIISNDFQPAAAGPFFGKLFNPFSDANIPKLNNNSKFIANADNTIKADIARFKAAAIAAITPAPPAPAPEPSPKLILFRFPPFLFPPPFIGPPFLSPFAPYGNAVIRTPVGSPFFRLPGLSLPPDFVPAVIPTVRQPMLSPFGNPFPTRVREPSPVYRNLFEEKSRPSHFRSPRFKMDGGYYAKYLKYKNKYLALKNQLENQV